MRYAFCCGAVPPGRLPTDVTPETLTGPEDSNVSKNRLLQMLSEFLS